MVKVKGSGKSNYRACNKVIYVKKINHDEGKRGGERVILEHPRKKCCKYHDIKGEDF